MGYSIDDPPPPPPEGHSVPFAWLALSVLFSVVKSMVYQKVREDHSYLLFLLLAKLAIALSINRAVLTTFPSSL
jgi:hypothetical protein